MSNHQARITTRRHHLGPIGGPIGAALTATAIAVAITVLGLPPLAPTIAGAAIAAVIAWAGRVGDARHFPAAAYRAVCWAAGGAWATAMPWLGWPILGWPILLAAVVVGVMVAPAVARAN